MTMRLLIWIAICSTAAAMSPRVLLADDLFENTIRPLFEKKCVGCHNPKDLKGGLSLESSAHFRRGGDSGDAIVVGDASGSYLIDLITPMDGKAEMPKGGPPLTIDERGSIQRWIEQGAVWPENVTLQPEIWWSLRPLVRPVVPQAAPLIAVDGISIPIRTPIDAFIQQSLTAHGLKPAAEAARRVLARRLYFDLVGLPPTPEQIEQFITDPHPLAYELLVDRLLESPQYGERWGRHWLDVARYADTCGYDKDKLRRNAWPYRDYVIRSFNEDKPYTRFVQEQIAGDVLFPGSQDGILGLGFIAAGPWDNIGHTEVSEAKIDGKIARSLDRDEMVSSTLNAFCSSTIQCARCHDHKFDPFTQAHYYGLQAVFAAVDRADRAYDISPEAEQKRLDLERSLRDHQAELAKINKEVENAVQQAGVEEQLKKLEARISSLKLAVSTTSTPAQFGYHSAISSDPEELKWVQIDLGRKTDLKRIVLHPCQDDFNGIGPGFGFPTRFRIEVATEADGFEKADQFVEVIDRTVADFANPGITPVEFSVTAKDVRWIRVTATRLALRDHDYIFSLAEVEAFDEGDQNIVLKGAVSAKDSVEHPERWAMQNLVDGLWPGRDSSAANEAYEAAMAERQQLLQQFESQEILKRRNQASGGITEAKSQLALLPQGQMVYAAATHFPPQGSFQPTSGQPREVRVLHRGNVQDPGEVAIPGALPVIPDFPPAFELPEHHREGDRRAALAKWVTRSDNPLTWRSIVNRVWQFHFGEGLAASPNDFGRMGKEPTHPELLDWLAVEFRDNGQSLKQLHRLIVTSSVYRQSSAHDAANAAIDGSNQFLWRMNRRRLEAEEIRDAILCVSGCMNLEMGGPGYFLFELEKEYHSPHYEYQNFNPTTPASHRRSVYRFIVRSQPDPYMTTLDCADSSQSTPRRNETVTALQALALLNNRFNLAMCEKFSQHLAEKSQDPSSQIQRGFQLITARSPTTEEQRELVQYADDFGMNNLCRLLLNLNEFIYID